MLMSWIVIAANNIAADSTDGKQALAQQSIANSLSAIAKNNDEQATRERSPDKLAQPCKAGDDLRDSDLCAQWKAADAAAEGANWAWVSGIATIISAIAVGLALHSNWIARETARRQLRAYAFVDHKQTVITRPQVGIRLGWTIKIGVFGQTPAYNLRGGIHFQLVPRPLAEGFDFSKRPPVTESSVTILPPGEDRHIFICGGEICTQDDLEQLNAGTKQLLMWGWIEYNDAFGTLRKLEYAYTAYGDTLQRGMFFPLRDFQKAT